MGFMSIHPRLIRSETGQHHVHQQKYANSWVWRVTTGDLLKTSPRSRNHLLC
ncbi:hypothetical protein HanPSC8_Chr12g0537081 [Helianthus annuus]|nr:hypothetical protein HanPSC8_Chr12g0537081 [Helianthus annuus]